MRWLSQAQFIGTTARATSRGHPVRFLDEACKLQSFLRLCSLHTRIPGHCSPIPACTHTHSLSLFLSPPFSPSLALTLGGGTLASGPFRVTESYLSLYCRGERRAGACNCTVLSGDSRRVTSVPRLRTLYHAFASMHSLAVVTSNRLLDHTLYAVASITSSSSSICLLLAAGIPPHPVTPSASLFSSFHFDSSQSRAPLFSTVSLTAPIASVPGSKAYAIHLSSNPTALLTRLAKIKGLQPNSNEVSHAIMLIEAPSTLKARLAPKRDWRCNCLMRRCDVMDDGTPDAYYSSDCGLYSSQVPLAWAFCRSLLLTVQGTA